MPHFPFRFSIESEYVRALKKQSLKRCEEYAKQRQAATKSKPAHQIAKNQENFNESNTTTTPNPEEEEELAVSGKIKIREPVYVVKSEYEKTRLEKI